MIRLEDVARLQASEGAGARILSVYRDLDPARQLRRSYRIAFEALVKETRARLGESSVPSSTARPAR